MNEQSLEQVEIEDVVYSLATSPNFAQDGICFAARRSGLYRSDDGGAAWQPTYDSLDIEESLPTTSVVLSPAFESDRSVFAGVPGGVLRSLDGGENWFVATLGSPPPVVSTLAISPAFVHDGTLFAGTMEDGVFRSADRGTHWVAWNFGLLDLNILAMAISSDFAEDETLLVGTETGIFRSTNGGRAWREVDFPTEYAPVLSLALSPRYADDGILFAGTESYGLFRSQDRGHTWVRLGEGVITDVVNAIVLSPEYPAQPEVLVMLDAALLVSRDDGASWSEWETDGAMIRGQNTSAVAAPQGLGDDARLLVGLVGGEVLRI